MWRRQPLFPSEGGPLGHATRDGQPLGKALGCPYVVGVGAADKMIDLVKNMIPVNLVEAAFKQVKLVNNLYQIIFWQ